MYNYEGVFIWNIQISLLSRLLMSIRLKKKFTETDLRKCISFILVKNILDQNPNKKMFRKHFVTFCMFFKFTVFSNTTNPPPVVVGVRVILFERVMGIKSVFHPLKILDIGSNSLERTPSRRTLLLFQIFKRTNGKSIHM